MHHAIFQLVMAGGLATALFPSTALAIDEYRVLVFKDGVPEWQIKPLPERQYDQRTAQDPTAAAVESLRIMVQAQLDTAAEPVNQPAIFHPFSQGTTIDSIQVNDGHATVRLSVPNVFFESLNESLSDEITRLTNRWSDWCPGNPGVVVMVRPFGTAEEHRLVPEFLPPPPQIPSKPFSDEILPAAPDVQSDGVRAPGQPSAMGQGQPTGALTGASVFITPSHGWYYSTTLDRWATQRGNSNNMIEDMNSAETVNQYLLQYLWNAGARVYVTRERDLQTNMVIVDAGGTGHSQTGTWTTESSTSAHGGSHRRATTVTGSPTATSTFTPNIPAAGYYGIYVWYRRAVAAGNTTTDAKFEIKHTGGTTTWVQDENRDGFTWKYIGTYYFDQGSNPGTGSVVINNQSSTAGNYVIADAVRFGGGMGSMVDPDAGGTSGKKRWEESGLYYAGFAGVPSWSSFGTVSAMPNYAEWEHESWEDGKSVYVSFHSNAGGGTGTETFAYSSTSSSSNPNGVAGGVQLATTIQTELINDIRAGWNSSWANRGVKYANFGELSPGNNNKMPAALTELAFHDTVSDAQALLDPNFRRLVSRAIYQAIVKYYRNNVTGFTNMTLLPEPPTNLRVVNDGDGAVTISWNAPPFNSGNNLLGDAATAYKVYKSTNGKGFDNGVATTANTLKITGLTPGQVYYFRVSATNSGGESFPTETLAAVPQPSGTPWILIVNGFDRIDRLANLAEDDPFDAKDLHRGYVARMNSYDYVIQHGKAVRANGQFFDSCSNEAVISGQVNLQNYGTVIWINGEESTADKTFDLTEQVKVTEFLDGGGRLFVSGSDMGFELDSLSAGATFYQDVLKGDFVNNDAGTYNVNAGTGTFTGLGSFTLDNGASVYNVDEPDVIQAIGGSTVNMTYSTGGGAAIQYAGAGTTRVIMLGFPFEAITNEARRTDLMGKALTFLGPQSSAADWQLYP